MVALLYAAVGAPSLIIIDEATSGVDILGRKAMHQVIHSLKRPEYGEAAMLFTTHHLDFSEMRDGLVNDGSITKAGGFFEWEGLPIKGSPSAMIRQILPGYVIEVRKTLENHDDVQEPLENNMPEISAGVIPDKHLTRFYFIQKDQKDPLLDKSLDALKLISFEQRPRILIEKELKEKIERRFPENQIRIRLPEINDVFQRLVGCRNRSECRISA